MHMLYEYFLDSHLDNQRLLSIKSSKYLMFPQRTVAESGFGQRLRYTSSLAKEMPRSGLAAIEESHEIFVVFQTMVLVYFEHLFKVCNALHFFFEFKACESVCSSDIVDGYFISNGPSLLDSFFSAFVHRPSCGSGVLVVCVSWSRSFKEYSPPFSVVLCQARGGGVGKEQGLVVRQIY